MEDGNDDDDHRGHGDDDDNDDDDDNIIIGRRAERWQKLVSEKDSCPPLPICSSFCPLFKDDNVKDDDDQDNDNYNDNTDDDSDNYIGIVGER